MDSGNNKNNNNHHHLTIRKPVFDKLTAHCKKTGDKKYIVTERALEAYLEINQRESQ